MSKRRAQPIPTDHGSVISLRAKANGDRAPLSSSMNWTPLEPGILCIVSLSLHGSSLRFQRQVYDNQANPSHQTVAQLLTCLDGLRSDSNIFVVAATNNVQALDPALTRSGRFDRIVQFRLPNKDARYRLLLCAFF